MPLRSRHHRRIKPTVQTHRCATWCRPDAQFRNQPRKGGPANSDTHRITDREQVNQPGHKRNTPTTIPPHGLMHQTQWCHTPPQVPTVCTALRHRPVAVLDRSIRRMDSLPGSPGEAQLPVRQVITPCAAPLRICSTLAPPIPINSPLSLHSFALPDSITSVHLGRRSLVLGSHKRPTSHWRRM